MAIATPGHRIEGACQELGRSDVIQRCLSLLAGGLEASDFIAMLGGAAGVRLLNEGMPEHQAYWLRVWAARGLLWAGPGEDAAVLRAALHDESWRVREMVCKVIARHRLGDLIGLVAELESDPVKRVRSAAFRAGVMIVRAET
ncbi:MAG: HEAT repeat domain-containing protein [Acidimicrobiales bacterium]